MPHYDPVKRCVMEGTTCMTGLNVALRTAFYPHFKHERASEGPLTTCSVPWPPNVPKDARARGRLLDRLVEQLCHATVNGDTMVALLARLNGNLEVSVHPQSVLLMRHAPEFLIRMLLEWLVESALVPRVSQLALVHTDARVGTPVDLVCQSQDGTEYTVFEMKLGYETYLERHTGQRMQAPFYFIKDSARWQHQLYLAFAVDLMAQHEPRLRRDKCAVVYLGRNGRQVIPLVPWGQRRTLIYRGWLQLVQRRNWDRKKRKGVCTEARSRHQKRHKADAKAVSC